MGISSPAKEQPTGNTILYICGLGASVGYERESEYKPANAKIKTPNLYSIFIKKKTSCLLFIMIVISNLKQTKGLF